jgi:hypothetical protein
MYDSTFYAFQMEDRRTHLPKVNEQLVGRDKRKSKWTEKDWTLTKLIEENGNIHSQ